MGTHLLLPGPEGEFMAADLPPLDPQTLLDLHGGSGSQETSELLAESARAAVGADSAGLLLHHRAGDVATASTDERVDEVQRLQLELGEGPCLDALVAEGPDVVWSVDLKNETRWSRWTPHAIGLGYRSVMTMGLSFGRRRLASLNIYSSRPDAFDTDDRAVALLMAQHTAAALVNKMENESLVNAIDARKTIGVATGFIMAKHDLTEDQAFAVLRRYSQHANVKLRTIAEKVVAERGLPHSPAEE